MSRRKNILSNLMVCCGAILLGPCLVYAQDGSETSNAIIEAANARKAVAEADEAAADAQKAASEARAAAAGALFGPLGNVQNSGNVSITNEAGALEVELLAATALRDAADQLGERLCQVVDLQQGRNRGDCQPRVRRLTLAVEPPRLPYRTPGVSACDEISYEEPPLPRSSQRPLIFVTQSDFAHFDVFESLMVRLTAAGRNMCHAIELAEEATAHTAHLRRLRQRRAGTESERGEGLVGGFGLEAASVALNTIAGLFRTEYGVQGVEITADAETDRLFARETILAFLGRRPDTPVFAPTLFPVTATAANNPLVRKLNILDDIRQTALAEATSQARLAQVFGAMGETVGDEHVAAVNDAASLHGERRGSLMTAITAYATLIDTASNPTAERPAALPTALRQARSVQLMRQGGILVVTETNTVGGSTLTRRNFFTAFGPMPFYVSGGALVSYSVMDGNSGQVLDSIAIPVAAGYEQIGDLHDRLRPRSRGPDRPRRRR